MVFLGSLPLGQLAVAAPVQEIGLFLPMGKTTKSQFDKAWHDLTPYFFKASGIQIKMRVFQTRKEMVTAIRSGKLIGLYTPDYTGVIEGVLSGNLLPAAHFSTFGSSQVKDCVYVNVASPYKTVKDLKGKVVYTYDREYAYQSLRQMVGKKPDEFFKLRPTMDGQSMVFSVAIGQVDAAYVNSFNVAYMKASNPGPIKKIRELGCGPQVGTSPILFSAAMPEATKKKVLEKLFNFQKDPNIPRDPVLRQYLGIVKIAKFSFVPSAQKDFHGLVELIRNARKNKWSADYDSWVIRPIPKDQK